MKRDGKKMDRSMEARRVGSEYLLSGLVTCGHVDGEEHPINVEHITGEKGKRGNYTSFICATMKNTRGKALQVNSKQLVYQGRTA